ncbi:MAG: protein kinase [Anaerolineae bacterium]|nr:protein kinase [Anaerolineae bacterium]
MNAVGKIGYRYRLGEQLGEGGMGAVYRAYDRLNGTEVALKQVNIPLEFLEFMSRASLGATTGLWMALAEEFKTLASLRHPHIISVLDYGFDTHRQPYYTMELLSQPTNLLDYGSNLTVSEKINLIIQVLQALAYLHRRGVIHRDLKPDNVLVVGGQAKVLDFGLAVSRSQQTEDTPAGTLHYMAPEVLNGQSASFSSDLYAVGVMAYQLFALTLPFDSDDGLENLIEAVTTQLADVNPLPIDAALKDVIGRLLAKTPADRYTNATEAMIALSQAVGQLPPSETVALRESFIQSAEFVGRQQELHQLKDALQEAMNSKGSAWLVGGESGVGKSRLLDELRTQALVDGALVVRGQAVEGGGLPYQLWREPLRRLVLSVELSDLEASVLKPIVADIGSLLERDIPDAPELPGEAGQQRLVQTILDVIRRQPHPMVLLLEDLQWCEESLEPLKRLTPLLADLPLLMVANYRSDERPDLPDKLPGMIPLSLMRLSTAEVAELSAGMLGEGGRDPVIIERLQQETEGNTFFMVEVVRALAEAAGRLDDISQMTLPRTIFAGGIEKLIRRRLDRVPEWGGKLLRFATLLGRQLELPVLKALVEQGHAGLSEQTLETWLTQCSDVGILDIQDENWRFSHDKLREHLQSIIAAEPHSMLYRTLAEAIEQAYPADANQAPRLSHYWFAAGEIEKAGQYAEVAGIHAANSSAYASAVQFFERALQPLPKDIPHIRRGQLLVKLANALREAGDVDRSSQLLEEALAMAALLNDRSIRLYVLNETGNNDRWQGKIDLAEQHYKEAAQLAEELQDRLMMVMTLRNCARVQGLQGNYADSKVTLLRVLELAQALQDEIMIGNSRYEIALMDMHMGQFEAAIDGFTHALSTFDRLGSFEQAIFTLSNLGMTYFNLQQLDLATTQFDRELSLARALGSPNVLANALGDCSMIPLIQNRLDEAEPLIAEALDISRKIKWSNGIIRNLMNLSEIKRMRQDYRSGKLLISEALDMVIAGNIRWAINAILIMVSAGIAEEGNLHEGYAIYDFLKHDPQTSQSDFAQVEQIFADNQQQLSEEIRAEIHQRNRHRTIDDIISIVRVQLADQSG